MVVSSLIVGFLNLNNVLGGSYWPKSDNHRLKGYMSYMSNKPKYKSHPIWKLIYLRPTRTVQYRNLKTAAMMEHKLEKK
jgi:hypothetical protein